MENNSYLEPRVFEGVLVKRLKEYQLVKYSIVRPQSDKINCFEKNCSQNNNNNESFLYVLSQMSVEENYAVVLPSVNVFYRLRQWACANSLNMAFKSGLASVELLASLWLPLQRSFVVPVVWH